MKRKQILLLLFTICSFGFGWAQDSHAIIQKFVAGSSAVSSQLEWEITSEHTSSTSGIHHIYFRQLVDNIPVLGTESGIHIANDGAILMESNRFVEVGSNRFEGLRSTIIPPQEAARSIARQQGYRQTSDIKILNTPNKGVREFWLSDGGFSNRPLKSQLLYAKRENESYSLVWEIDVLETDHSHWWEFQVDAESGVILGKLDRMNSCGHSGHICEINSEEKKNWPKELFRPIRVSSETNASCTECYEVFDYPLESPYFGDRTIVENPAHPVASPYGWHDTDGVPGPEYFDTRGNNVDAYEANDNFGYHPEGGINLNFTGFPFDTEYSNATQYEDASITNLFYWSNLIHDITYQYGFNELSGNFQVNNYGRGGEEGDDIIAFGQSVDRPCNGSFSTPPDGERPLMIINLCGNKDGNFDTTLIAHEWGHGLSSRLSGGGVFTNCLRHVENPMEGWSDWLSAILTIEEGDTGDRPRYIASYLRNHGPNGPGVRFYPYSTNMSMNPLTYGDLPNRSGVHRIGAIWGTMIWEMTWALIDEYGFDPDITTFTGNINQDSGNVMALAIVTEGLKLTPCQPGFVDARDGIVTAARQIYGREVLCVIWDAFAKRGLGSLADQGDPDNQFDGFPSFETPFEQASFEGINEALCVEAGYYGNLGGGYPLGGVYSGNGVIDNGDGETFDFDPVLAGTGTHTITYDLGDTICSSVSSASIAVSVLNDTVPPEVDCIEDPIFSVPLGVPYSLNDFINVTVVGDDCSGVEEVTQSPPPGTPITERQTDITIRVMDVAGNVSSCTFTLNLVFVSEVQLQTGELFLTPNPTRGEFSLINPKERRIDSFEIWDMIGRRILYSELNNSHIENILSVESLSTGTYFVMVKSAGETKIFRIVKL